MKIWMIFYRGSVSYSVARVLLLFFVVLVAFAVPLVADGGRVMTLLTAIITVAGVVVTVFGIWIAVIFPRLLSRIKAGENVSNEAEGRRYFLLIESLYRSGFVLCASCLVFFLVSFFSDYRTFFHPVIFCFCFFCLFSLFESLWVAIWMGESSSISKINEARLEGVVQRRRRRK